MWSYIIFSVLDTHSNELVFYLNIFGVLYFMNRLRSINHQALKTGELLVREGLARQQDVDAALNVQLNEGDAENPSPAASYSINRSDDVP